MRQFIRSALTLAIVSSLAPSRVSAASDRKIAFDFRGCRWEQAVRQVAERSPTVIEIEGSLPAETRERVLRFQLQRLTTPQVIRWLARIGGVAAIRVGDGWLLGDPKGWPAAWQARWRTDEARGPNRNQPESANIDLRVDISWSDYPLSAALSEIQRHYEVDVIVEPSVLDQQELLSISMPQVRWSDLADEIAHRLGVDHAAIDGVHVFGHPEWLFAIAGERTAATPISSAGSDDAEPTGQLVVANRAPLPPGEAELAGMSWRTVWIRLDLAREAPGTALQPLAGLIGEAVDWRPTSSRPAREALTGLRAEGPAGQILEALRLLGRLDWRAEASRAPKKRVEKPPP